MSVEKIVSRCGKAIPVRGNDIDTDRIIPARFMKCVTFEGLGEFAFFDARFNEDGSQKGHSMNEARFAQGSVLLVNQNFGCGSSREHAPQALAKYGIKALIGESFAEIFAGNCVSLGIPAVMVSHEDIEAIMEIVEATPDTEVCINLAEELVSAGDKSFKATLRASSSNALQSGNWDSTSVLLSGIDEIRAKRESLPY